MQMITKAKRISYKELQKCRNEANLEKYKLAKKESKEAVNEAKSKAYENLGEARKKSKREWYR